jgi:predicted GNAT family acetyltransferase
VSDPRLTVLDNPDKQRFELYLDGEMVGLADYVLELGRIAFVHTEVESDRRLEGMAGYLVGVALDSARERGLQVVPLCPYVASFIRRNPQYADLL